MFPHWADADRDVCDTRDEVLIAESRITASVAPAGCRVTAGSWFSRYDGATFSNPGGLDIDHVVALGEAWDSGASAWDTARRTAFANDLDDPPALVAVSASSNRSKGDDDPAEWKPPRREAWCEFGVAWLTVKVAWDLTADQLEVTALRTLLVMCEGGVTPPISPPAAPPVVPPAPPPRPCLPPHRLRVRCRPASRSPPWTVQARL